MKALLSPTEALETATAAAKMSQNVAEQSMTEVQSDSGTYAELVVP